MVTIEDAITNKFVLVDGTVIIRLPFVYRAPP